jgi:hydroxyacylglutathione hydrolase
MLTSSTNQLTVETFPIGTLGCNCSLIYSPETREAIIVDPGNDAPTLLALVKQRNLKVRLLLHTHAHFDHIGQSHHVSAATGAKRYLHRGDQFLYDALPQQGQFFGQKVDSVIPPLDGYLNHEETFGLEQEAQEDEKNEKGLREQQGKPKKLNTFLKVLHTPGHTPGSVCFYTDFFETPILFSGDTLFNQSIGRTDLPGGDTQQILKSIKNTLYQLPDETKVICGHGQSTLLHKEKRSNPFIRL